MVLSPVSIRRISPPGQTGSTVQIFHRSTAFTLTELLVVISLIISLLAISWPVLRMLQEGSRLDTAVNALSSASQVLRMLSTTPIPDLDLEIPGARYDGTALIIRQEYRSNGEPVSDSPTGADRFVPKQGGCLPIAPATIHLTYNNQQAKNSNNNFLESLSPPYNGFDDFPDYSPISLPPDIGVAGIVVPGQYAVATSLAVRFDRHGQLLVSGLTTDPSTDNRPRLAVYDFTDDDEYDTPGDPPKEAVPAVLGLVLYHVSHAKAAGLLPVTDSNVGSGKVPLLHLRRNDSNPGLLDNASGRLIFFDRYTGAVMKE